MPGPLSQIHPLIADRYQKNPALPGQTQRLLDVDTVLGSKR